MPNIDIVLINPNDKKQTYGALGQSLSGIEPPLWIGLLAAFLRNKGFIPVIIDAAAEDLSIEQVVDRIVSFNPQLVGIGAIGSNPSASSTPKMAGIRDLLLSLKEKNTHIKTFLYGIHPSALAERTLREEAVDFVIRGEAFYPALKLLQSVSQASNDYCFNGLCYLENGCFVDQPWAELVQDLDELPFVAWDLLPMDRYRAHNWHCFDHIDDRKPYAVIYSSLGCPFQCHYCNIHALYSGEPGIRFRSPQSFINEVDLLVREYGIRHLKILDELFVINEKRMLDICDLLISRKYDLNIWAYARVDTVSKTMLAKLKAAGINWLAYGIEAGSHDVRKGVLKGRFDEENIKQAIAMTHQAGIHVIGNFMFGLPDDDLDTMKQTLALAQELNCEYVNFYTTMAYPGSALYQQALDQGFELPEDWQGFSQLSSQTLPLRTKHLTAQQVLEFRDRAFKEYYSSQKYQDMIQEKFGQKTLEHIQEMLKFSIKRDLLLSTTQGDSL